MSLQSRSKKMREQRAKSKAIKDKIRDDARAKYTKKEVTQGKNRLAADLKSEERKALLKNPGMNEKTRKRLTAEQERADKRVKTKKAIYGPAPAPKVNKKKASSLPSPKKIKQNQNIGPNMSAVNKPKSDDKGKGFKLKKDATVRKTDREETKKKKEKFDRMAAARNQQRMAQKSMGFKKGGAVKRDGCAMRGKTKGRMV